MPKPVIVPLALAPATETPPRAPAIPTVIELQMCAVLSAPIAMNETIERGFQRKECELSALFATLTTLQSRTLYQRLAHPAADDTVATLFTRLVADRRARLLGYLAGARRRAALRGAGA